MAIDAASVYPPQIPHGRPSSGSHGRPRFVLPNGSHVLLCLTPLVVFSQCLPSAGAVNSGSSVSVCCDWLRQSQGDVGLGSLHNPLRSRLAASSASERSSSSEQRLKCQASPRATRAAFTSISSCSKSGVLPITFR